MSRSRDRRVRGRDGRKSRDTQRPAGGIHASPPATQEARAIGRTLAARAVVQVCAQHPQRCVECFSSFDTKRPIPRKTCGRADIGNAQKMSKARDFV